MDKLSRIVADASKMTLLGGGSVDFSDLSRALRIAPLLICADSGGNQALFHGFSPDFVIGDMDSADLEELHKKDIEYLRIEDQNSTDFEKCINNTRVQTILAVGFLGGRLDHELAALNALAKAPGRLIILIGEEDICFLCPSRFALEMEVGDRFSVFPLSAATARSTGLEWPLDGLKFDPVGQTGTSNRVASSSVEIEAVSGDLICILPKAYLEKVIENADQTDG